MTTKPHLAVALSVLAVALTPGVALAHHPAQTLTLKPANITFAEPSSQCPEGTIGFDLQSPAGAMAGTGSSCIQRIRPLGTFGQHVHAVLELQLAHGSLTVDSTIEEIFLSESSEAQLWQGTVVRGTGRYAGARGKLVGGGTLAFNPDGSVDSTVVYVIRLR
jgi:hypothetical protein